MVTDFGIVRIVPHSTTGVYSAKDGYRFWHRQNSASGNTLQCRGWKRLWSLLIPHKIKIFIWRFCRNTISVRSRLSTKGVSLPITCPMCNVDIEHLLHLFFDCQFASQCWNYVELSYDMMSVEYALDWLLYKLSDANLEEINKICTTLWGIWMWRNKRVWEGKIVSARLAMDNSFYVVSEWRNARLSHLGKSLVNQQPQQTQNRKWKPPSERVLKVNVDASFITGSPTFSVGMVLRDHTSSFIKERNLCLISPGSVFEAEAIGVREALSWIKMLKLHNHRIELESDSLMVVQGIEKKTVNLLEVGEVLEQCRLLLNELLETSIHFVRNQANSVTHEIARLPYLVNCHIVLTSLPTCLVETVPQDSSF